MVVDRSSDGLSLARWAARHVFLDPYEMGAAMQAESIQVHDVAHAPERQPLLMAMTAHILTAMRQETAPAAHRRA
jgi:hypothetical protein